ncbi:hypothetical protein OEA41_001085 [Lepraria neglecta]|uniref:Uncharacterized protein n=1 Tax=Lepraria neglecta TaxID=209136 RepID=A0AAE0DQD2_9LECA|nr:hypothetical protein OEA41_001085 [Lepraria neglecta]
MKHSLASMVQQCSNRLCSDPRDAIYALLNLSLPIDIEPDYERPVEHLYMMATKTLINCEQDLNIISTTCALVHPGDRVFVARGSTGPLILRPASADETYDATRKKHSISTFYELVGGCYVQGIVDGEVVEMMGKGDVQEETVFLV